MTTRQVYPATERQSTNVPLNELIVNGTLDFYPEVLSKGFFTFTLKGSDLVLIAGNCVGLIPLNARAALNIEPKIAKDNWLYIVGKAHGRLRELPYLRSYSKGGLSTRPLIEFLSRAFILQLQSVEQGGLYRQYQLARETTSFPRGRISFAESITQVWSRGHKRSLAIDYYQFSKDIPQNRLLRYALELSIQYLTRVAGTPTFQGVRMADLEDLFLSVPLDSSLKYLPEVIASIEDGSIPEGRSYYVDIAKTAILLVEFSGLLPATQGRETTLSFVVNMETVFEDYCFHVLRENIIKFNWDLVQRGREESYPLFSGPGCDTRKAEPDLIIQDLHHQLLLEVKYKEKPNRQDINQAITYALAYNSERVVLLCFWDSGQRRGWQFLGLVGNKIAVWVYRIDLNSADIEAEESLFVHAVADMIRGEIRSI